jgi:hypothetical protein
MLNQPIGPIQPDLVRQFQEEAGLKVDGIVGHQTWSYIHELLSVMRENNRLLAAEIRILDDLLHEDDDLLVQVEAAVKIDHEYKNGRRTDLDDMVQTEPWEDNLVPLAIIAAVAGFALFTLWATL